MTDYFKQTAITDDLRDSRYTSDIYMKLRIDTSCIYIAYMKRGRESVPTIYVMVYIHAGTETETEAARYGNRAYDMTHIYIHIIL